VYKSFSLTQANRQEGYAYNIALVIWRGDGSFHLLHIDNQLRFQPTNNAGHLLIQSTFVFSLIVGSGLDGTHNEPEYISEYLYTALKLIMGK
jgi:hypothetical protein